MIHNMQNLSLEKLNIDSSNVNQVYEENLKNWQNNNGGRNPKDFVIREIDYLLNINPDKISELDAKRRAIYSVHLSKIKSNFPWDLEDYYNRYIETKEFHMTGFILIKSIGYEDFKKKLKEYKTQYYYIFDKLSNDDKIQLKCDFNDQLNHLKSKELATKFIVNIDEIINEIDKHDEKDNFKLDSFLKNKNDLSENPFPKLFTSAIVYKCFIEYTSKHIIDYHLDYSYLIRRLKFLNLIYQHNDHEYMRILFEDMNLIKKRDYDNYIIEKRKLYTVSKSYNIHRQNNFNNIFEELID